MGTVLLFAGDRDRAVSAFEEGLSLAREAGDRLGTYNALYNLAQLATARGDHELATRMFEEGVELSKGMGDRANLAHFLEGLAGVAGMRGDAARSATLFGAAQRLSGEAGAPPSTTTTCQPPRCGRPPPGYARPWATPPSRRRAARG